MSHTYHIDSLHKNKKSRLKFHEIKHVSKIETKSKKLKPFEEKEELTKKVIRPIEPDHECHISSFDPEMEQEEKDNCYREKNCIHDNHHA